MYSLLPAVVSAIFLGYGFYVVAERGFNRVSTSFFALCVTTFFWQGTWAVLFQVRDPQLAAALAKAGYLLILFLPTSLYQFLVEISRRTSERRYVAASYALAGGLGAFLLFTDWFVDGVHAYFWGFYPKAGWLHPLHVAQTVLVVNRGLYITYRQQQSASGVQRTRLRLCIASVLVYFFAAVDYLCNYGLEFYPPGVVFTAVSLGLIAVAVTKYELMSPVAVAATVAHEMRTPLASIRMQAEALAEVLPRWHKGYELAVSHGLVADSDDAALSQRLAALPASIQHQVDRSNTVIDMMLASARMEQIDTGSFTRQDMGACVAEALETYPFGRGEREKVHVRTGADFAFHGSGPLLVFVLFNLLKNSLYAIKSAGRGDITIELARQAGTGILRFTDTGSGIPAEVLPRIFENFFTTKKSGGAGIGLAFSRRVAASFGGTLECASEPGRYTTFTLAVPALPEPEAGLR